MQVQILPGILLVNQPIPGLSDTRCMLDGAALRLHDSRCSTGFGGWTVTARTLRIPRYRLHGPTRARPRTELGLDVTRAVLGVAARVVTEVYAEVDQAKAVAAVDRFG